MVAYGVRNNAEIVSRKPKDFRVGNQVLAMLVMAARTDEVPDIVKKRGHLEK
jgi:hypothetical protein